MRQVIRKTIKKPIILISTILLTSCVLLYLCLWTLTLTKTLFFTGGIQGKTTVHKAMNHNQYNIVIVSRAFSKGWSSPYRGMLLEIWVDDKKTKNYFICDFEEGDIYNWEVKDVVLLPDSNEVKIEFHSDYGIGPDGKTHTSVGLYKIADD